MFETPIHVLKFEKVEINSPSFPAIKRDYQSTPIFHFETVFLFLFNMWCPFIFILATLVPSQVVLSTILEQQKSSDHHQKLFYEHDATKNVVYYLDWFFDKNLRSYVDENFFYFQQFDSEINTLTNYLEIIARFISLARVESPRIQKKLAYARYNFEHMVVATQIMKHFSESSEPGAILVTQVTDLFVRTLRLYDNDGNSNVELDRYETQVSEMFCQLYSLEDDYRKEDRMVLFARNAFLEYFQNAAESLGVSQKSSRLTRQQRSCW